MIKNLRGNAPHNTTVILSIKSTTADNYQELNVTEVKKEVTVGPYSTKSIEVMVPWKDYADKLFEEAILKTTLTAKDHNSQYFNYHYEQCDTLTKPVVQVMVRS